MYEIDQQKQFYEEEIKGTNCERNREKIKIITPPPGQTTNTQFNYISGRRNKVLIVKCASVELKR